MRYHLKYHLVHVAEKCSRWCRMSAFIVFMLAAFDAAAQSVSATTKEKEYQIGDWVPVDFFVSAARNVKVAFPAWKDSLTASVEVANYTSIDTVKNGNQSEYHQLVNMIVFDTGQVYIPAVPFLVSSGSTTDTLWTEPIKVHVAGVKIDTTKDIKPIKEPLKIPYTFREILPYLLGALLLIAAIAAIIWWWKRRKNKQQSPPDEKYLLPPHVWAIKELDKLKQDKLWQTGDVKSYYSRLTDIARTYIELRYKIPAMEQTTEELMQALHKGIIKQSLKKDLNDMLVLSDFVKFAKAMPGMSENEQSFEVTRDFIEKTKQIETAPSKNGEKKK